MQPEDLQKEVFMSSINKSVTVRSQVTGSTMWPELLVIMLLPCMLSADSIDKTKPASIPTEIVAAWKDQDGVSG